MLQIYMDAKRGTGYKYQDVITDVHGMLVLQEQTYIYVCIEICWRDGSVDCNYYQLFFLPMCYVNHIRAWCLQRPEDNAEFPWNWTQTLGRCYGGAGNQAWVPVRTARASSPAIKRACYSSKRAKFSSQHPNYEAHSCLCHSSRGSDDLFWPLWAPNTRGIAHTGA